MADTRIQVESPDGYLATIAGQGKGDLGVWANEGGIEGLWAPDMETIYNSTAYQEGGTFGGERYNLRKITLEVNIFATPFQPWEKSWSDWIKAFHTNRDTKIWYETDSGRRFLNVRLFSHWVMNPGVDPNRRNHAKVTMNLVAGIPWWYEPSLTDDYVTTTNTAAGGTENGTVSVWNDTPLPVYPEWVFQGVAGIEWTLPDHSFGQEAEHDRPEGADLNRVINLPPTVAGEHVLIDVDPLAINGQANSSLDTEYSMRMNGVRFIYPIPAYTGTIDDPVILPVAVTGAPVGAGVQIRLRRAWPTPMGMY